MTRLSLYAMLAGLLCLTVGCHTSKGFKKYIIKNGTIKYIYSFSDTAYVKQTIYFDDYGAKEAIKTTAYTISGEDTIRSSKLTIATPKFIYTINLDDSTGIRMFNDPAKMTKLLLKEVERSDLPEETKQQLSLLLQTHQKKSYQQEMPIITEVKELQPVRQDTFLGKTCDVYRVTKTITGEVYVWNMIPLKTIDTTGRVVQRAVEVNTNPVPRDAFKVPEGVKIQDYIEKFREALQNSS